MAVSICTINLNGITELPKCKKVFQYLLDKHFDVSRRHIYRMSSKASSGKLNGVAMFFGPRAQTDRSGWAYFSILGAELKFNGP